MIATVSGRDKFSSFGDLFDVDFIKLDAFALELRFEAMAIATPRR